MTTFGRTGVLAGLVSVGCFLGGLAALGQAQAAVGRSGVISQGGRMKSAASIRAG